MFLLAPVEIACQALDLRVVHEDVGVVQAEAEFGGRVREARTAQNWTQRQLAEVLGVDASAVSRLEQGTRAIRLGEAAAIADALGANLDALVYGKGTARQLQTFGVAALRLFDHTRQDASELGEVLATICDILTQSPHLLGSRAATMLTTMSSDDELPRNAVEYLREVELFIESRSNSSGFARTTLADPQLAEGISRIVAASVRGVVDVDEEVGWDMSEDRSTVK